MTTWHTVRDLDGGYDPYSRDIGNLWSVQSIKFPVAPCVYVIYIDGTPYYIGSTRNMRARMFKYWRDSQVWRTPSVVVKFSVSRRYGDWLMREVRLIRRLSPRANNHYNDSRKKGWTPKPLRADCGV